MALICAILLAGFAVISFMAVRTKSPTFDEPLHTLAAWLQRHEAGYLMDPANPPLWKHWAALPNARSALASPPTDAQYRAMSEPLAMTAPYVVPILFRTPGTDGDAVIARSRVMMLILATAIGVIVAAWSWKLGGGVAAIVATMAFALDPNLLAHGPLVKNDCTLALVLVGLAMTVWCAGLRLTIVSASTVALLCAAAVTVKHSGVLFAPIVVLMLLTRAVQPTAWICLGQEMRGRAARLGAAGALCLFALLVSYAGIWATYGFRFAPGGVGRPELDVQGVVDSIAYRKLTLAAPVREPSYEQVRAWRPAPSVRTLLFLERHRLLPEAWITGMLMAYRIGLQHDNFLAGEISQEGWWYYFPAAMLLKSPLALLAASALALIVGFTLLRSRRTPASDAPFAPRWATICLTVPPAIFLLFAMTSRLNYGLRHILPVYPFIYIGIGLAAAHCWQRRPRGTALIVGVLSLALAVETLAAFPNYIAFFNLAAGGSNAGAQWLGDSNVDWGQDLKLLADWQRRHPERELHLAYYGCADPAFYGIRYKNLPGGLGPPAPGTAPATTPATQPVFAISATILQGIYSPDHRAFYAPFRRATPTEILGGSIYLYDPENP